MYRKSETFFVTPTGSLLNFDSLFWIRQRPKRFGDEQHVINTFYIPTFVGLNV